MSQCCVVAAALALCAGSAIAADLPSGNEVPAVAPPPSRLWTGVYAGLNAGYGLGADNNLTTTAAAVVDKWASSYNALARPRPGSTLAVPGLTSLASSGVASLNQNGFVGGGQVGFNVQFGPSFVAGLEVDVQGSATRGSGSNSASSRDGIILPPFTPNGAEYRAIRTAVGVSQYTAGVEWVGTMRGRLGWLATETLLVYGTGGLAYGGVHASVTHAHGALNDFTLSGTRPISVSLPTFGGTGGYWNTHPGWTAGGGFEWLVAPNWSVRAEAFFYDLGSATFASTPIGAFSLPVTGALAWANTPITRVRYDGVIGRAGINYHLNWGSTQVITKF